MWSTIPVSGPPFRYAIKNWTNSHRNPGPDPTGIADQFPPESLDQLDRNPHFEKERTGRAYLAELRERLAKFGLTLHPDKTRLIEFGRYAAERRRKRGQGRPETFDFLGFTHCCGTDQQGKFQVVRLTAKKRACEPR